MKKTLLIAILTLTGCYQQENEKYTVRIDKTYEMECKKIVGNEAARIIRCENNEAICYIGTYRTTLDCKFK